MATRNLKTKLIAWATALAIMLTLLPTAYAADKSVDISDESVISVKHIEEAVQAAIDAASSGGGGTVNVSGTYKSIISNNAVYLNIPANVTVKWAATYVNDMRSTATSSINSELIRLNGAGTFEMAGGALKTTHASSGYAIQAFDTVAIKVSGGEIFSQANYAITTYTDVQITGGTVSTNGTDSNAVCVIVAWGDVSISGSAIVSAPNGLGIRSNGTIIMSGGSVTSSDDTLLAINGISVTGGAAASTGSKGGYGGFMSVLNSFIDIISTEPFKDLEGFVTHGDNVVASVRA